MITKNLLQLAPRLHYRNPGTCPRCELYTYESLLNSAPDASSRARLLSVACKESGAWLDAPPVTSLGLRMDNEVICIALGLRLGLPLCDPHPCTQHNQEVGRLGTHGLSCRFSKGRHSRHAAVNDIIKRSLASLKIPSHLEPSGLYRSDGKRPDGVTIVPWKRGCICFCFRCFIGTIICPVYIYVVVFNFVVHTNTIAPCFSILTIIIIILNNQDSRWRQCRAVIPSLIHSAALV